MMIELKIYFKIITIKINTTYVQKLILVVVVWCDMWMVGVYDILISVIYLIETEIRKKLTCIQWWEMWFYKSCIGISYQIHVLYFLKKKKNNEWFCV